MFDWRSLPVHLAAALAAGLPPDSRSYRKLSGEKTSVSVLLQASIADSLNRLEWRLCCCRGKAPPSILCALQGTEPESSSAVLSFDTPKAFEAAMAAVEGGVNHGN